MKYIPKEQLGGRVFIHTTPMPQPLSSGGAASSKSGDDGKLISDDIFKTLTQKGITSDVNLFTDTLIDIENKYKYSSVPLSVLYKLQAEANKIINNANNLKLAELEAIKNQALSDVAIDDNGYMFTINEDGKIEKTHISKYDKDKLQVLTIGQLIDLRKNNSSLAYLDSISTVVKKSVGMPKINDFILKIIKTVGTSSDTTEAYHELVTALGSQYAKKPTEQQLAGLLEMAEIAGKLGTDALFKIKEGQSSKNIEAAFDYIYRMLPENMKWQLRGNYVAQGGSIETAEKNTLELIQSALFAANDTKYTFGIKYESNINKAAGTTAGLKEMTPLKSNMGVLDILVQGTLGKSTYDLRLAGTNEMMRLYGTQVGSLASTHNTPISDYTPLGIALNEGLSPMIDKNHMMMGNQRLEQYQLNQIVYDGKEVMNIWAPMNSNGDIDLEALQDFTALQNDLKTKTYISNEEKTLIMNERGFLGYFDLNGDFHGTGNMGLFIVLTGITTDNVIDKNNLFADELTGDARKAERQRIEQVYALLNKGKKGNAVIEFPTNLFHRDIIHVPIFMKLSSTAQTDVASYRDRGPLYATPTYDQQIAYDQSRYSRQSGQIQMPSSNFLYE